MDFTVSMPYLRWPSVLIGSNFNAFELFINKFTA